MAALEAEGSTRMIRAEGKTVDMTYNRESMTLKGESITNSSSHDYAEKLGSCCTILQHNVIEVTVHT